MNKVLEGYEGMIRGRKKAEDSAEKPIKIIRRTILSMLISRNKTDIVTADKLISNLEKCVLKEVHKKVLELSKLDFLKWIATKRGLIKKEKRLESE